jgi:hypothetical protein
VHWILLLVASCVFDGLAEKFLPTPYSEWIAGFLIDAWALYFCLWLRKLDRESVDFRWCIGMIATGILGDVLGDITSDTSWIRFMSLGLIIGSVVVYVFLIFSIRATLLRHYNEREPVGLTLSPWMTILFSFYYFQYHLYPIAQFKGRAARGDIANPGRTFLS